VSSYYHKSGIRRKELFISSADKVGMAGNTVCS
jgi:hypothetical protein